MEAIKKILAPTDLSELSCIGLRHALEMGRLRGAEVIVYHVIDLADQWAKPEHSGPVREMLECHKQSLDKFLREKFPDEMNLTEVRQWLSSAAPWITSSKRRKLRGGQDRYVNPRPNRHRSHADWQRFRKSYRPRFMPGPDHAGAQAQDRKGCLIDRKLSARCGK